MAGRCTKSEATPCSVKPRTAFNHRRDALLLLLLHHAAGPYGNIAASVPASCVVGIAVSFLRFLLLTTYRSTTQRASGQSVWSKKCAAHNPLGRVENYSTVPLAEPHHCSHGNALPSTALTLFGPSSAPTPTYDRSRFSTPERRRGSLFHASTLLHSM